MLFDVNNPATWPQSFQQQIPGFFADDSKQVGANDSARPADHVEHHR